MWMLFHFHIYTRKSTHIRFDWISRKVEQSTLSSPSKNTRKLWKQKERFCKCECAHSLFVYTSKFSIVSYWYVLVSRTDYSVIQFSLIKEQNHQHAYMRAHTSLSNEILNSNKIIHLNISSSIYFFEIYHTRTFIEIAHTKRTFSLNLFGDQQHVDCSIETNNNNNSSSTTTKKEKSG